MKKLFPIMSMLALWSCQQTEQSVANLNYPDTKKVGTVDVYFGTEVPDPYRC